VQGNKYWPICTLLENIRDDERFKRIVADTKAGIAGIRPRVKQ
jgi:hypothetical protein